jgi:hypothetical protein
MSGATYQKPVPTWKRRSMPFGLLYRTGNYTRRAPSGAAPTCLTSLNLRGLLRRYDAASPQQREDPRAPQVGPANQQKPVAFR